MYTLGLGCNVTNIRNYRFDGKNFSEDSQYEVVMAECVGWDHLASDTYLESTNLYFKKNHTNQKITKNKQHTKTPKTIKTQNTMHVFAYSFGYSYIRTREWYFIYVFPVSTQLNEWAFIQIGDWHWIQYIIQKRKIFPLRP